MPSNEDWVSFHPLFDPSLKNAAHCDSDELLARSKDICIDTNPFPVKPHMGCKRWIWSNWVEVALIAHMAVHTQVHCSPMAPYWLFERRIDRSHRAGYDFPQLCHADGHWIHFNVSLSNCKVAKFNVWADRSFFSQHYQSALITQVIYCYRSRHVFCVCVRTDDFLLCW